MVGKIILVLVIMLIPVIFGVLGNYCEVKHLIEDKAYFALYGFAFGMLETILIEVNLNIKE